MDPPKPCLDNGDGAKSVKAKRKRRSVKTDDAQNAIASLRRLKIQETLLEKAATSALEDQQLKVYLQALSTKRNNDFKNLKKSYYAAKSQFEKLQYGVSSVDRVSKTDIEEYKKIAMDLDERIISFKTFVEKELAELQKSEAALTAEIREAERNIEELNTKLAVRPYTAIVPSAVKTMRNSPSSCSEVQRFQEFLQASGGHRGGWGDQEHSIFVSLWKRLSGSSPGAEAFERQLVDALVEKIPGITAEEIVTHEAWYRQYVRLKADQQGALDRWRRARMLTKQQGRLAEETLGDQNCCKSEKAEKPKSATKTRKPLDIVPLEMARNIEEVKLRNLPTISETNRFDSLNAEPIASADVPAVTKPAESVLVPKTERPCRVRKTPKQSIERGVIDSLKTEKNTNKEILSALQGGAEREGASGTATEADEGVMGYLTPTKLWNLRAQLNKGEEKCKDFRLHIPMANTPKLSISNWRRCLVGEILR